MKPDSEKSCGKVKRVDKHPPDLCPHDGDSISARIALVSMHHRLDPGLTKEAIRINENWFIGFMEKVRGVNVSKVNGN